MLIESENQEMLNLKEKKNFFLFWKYKKKKVIFLVYEKVK